MYFTASINSVNAPTPSLEYPTIEFALSDSEHGLDLLCYDNAKVLTIYPLP